MKSAAEWLAEADMVLERHLHYTDDEIPRAHADAILASALVQRAAIASSTTKMASETAAQLQAMLSLHPDGRIILRGHTVFVKPDASGFIIGTPRDWYDNPTPIKSAWEATLPLRNVGWTIEFSFKERPRCDKVNGKHEILNHEFAQLFICMTCGATFPKRTP